MSEEIKTIFSPKSHELSPIAQELEKTKQLMKEIDDLKKKMEIMAMQSYHQYIQFRDGTIIDGLIIPGNLDLAISNIRLAIQYKPKNPLFHEELGHILLDKRQESEAIESFKRAAMLIPVSEQPDFYHDLVFTLCENEHYALAESYCKAVIKSYPEDERAYKTLVSIYKTMADDADAPEERKKFLAKILFVEGEWAWINQMYAKAKNYFSQAVAKDPENAVYKECYKDAGDAEL